MVTGVKCIAQKTNFLYALRLVLDANLSSYFRQLTEHDFNSSMDISVPQQVVVSAEFAGFKGHVNQCALVGCWQVSEDLARLSYRFRPKRAVRDSISSGERQPEGLTLDDYHWELTGGGDADPASVNWDEELGQSIRFADLQSFLVVFLQAIRNVEEDLRQSRFSPLGRLFSATDIAEADKNTLVAILKEANDKVATSHAVSATGDAISGAFRNTVGDAFKMAVRLGLADPSFASISRSLTVLLSEETLKDFEPSRNGLGLNNILYVSMLLEFLTRRVSQGQTAGQILLCEEPEAHLHPQLQVVLYQALVAKGVQVILTTHSTHLTAKSGLSQFVVLTKSEGAIAASSNIAAKASLSSSEVADLERYLDATRSTLLYARKVMLVEGPAELFLIPPLVKSVLDIDLEREGISVIPIYGVHFGAYTRLFKEDVLPKKCALVGDADLSAGYGQSPDAPNSDEDTPPVPDRLLDLEGAFVKAFTCERTFEVALALPGLLPMLAEAATQCGAPRAAAALSEARTRLSGKVPVKTQRALLGEMGELVLRTAIRFGKARFAQVAARHTHLAVEIPQYIRDAVTWLTNE